MHSVVYLYFSFCSCLSTFNWGFIESKDTELAASKPDPATAGTPIPGKQESPHNSKLFIGVPGNGKDPSPALMAGP